MITVCTTIPTFIVLNPKRGYWDSWIHNAEAVMAASDDEVRYFAVLETDARGLEPFAPVIDRLKEIDGTYWTFSFDDGSDYITTANRLIRITTGQNFASHYSMATGATHELFLAADTRIPDDAIPRLLELNWPICALDTPTYCLNGPFVDDPSYPSEWDIREHMASAACLFRSREVFRKLRWRIDGDMGMTDDPCMHHDAKTLLGYETRVRHDILASHFPEQVPAIEFRHPKHVMRVHRDGE